MKKQTRKELKQASEAMDAANRAGPKAWDVFLDEHEMNAKVEFPLGELMNPDIAGYVWAWAMQQRINHASIGKRDGFRAQGLEGKAVVETTFATALLVWRDLPAYRCNVYA